MQPRNPNADRSPSEYEGGGVQSNTIYPKGADALTASDKLRLHSITGQTEDPNATPDPGFWYGNAYFDPDAPEYVDPARIEKERRLAREDAVRYRETPRPSQY